MCPNEASISESPAASAPDSEAASPHASELPDDNSVAAVPPYSVFTPNMRTYLTYLLGVTITLSTLTASIYFPLIPMLATHYATSIQAINLTVTAYAVCQALSPAVFASLADARGRRPVLLALVALYALASLGLALSQSSYAALMALRAVQIVGGSATPPLAYGVVADMAPPSERGGMLGPLLSTCNAISALGPVVGGAVAQGTGGTQWIFLALLLLALVCLAFVAPRYRRRRGASSEMGQSRRGASGGHGGR